MKSKKAMTQETLITVIIIVISFIVLGYAALKITGIIGPTMTKETCHTSALLRGYSTTLTKLGITPELKCKTEYKCLTAGGKCPENYEKIPVATEDDIKRELANALYDCWWQLGEGKLNFMGRPIVFNEKTCVICSQITFDDKVKEKIKTINDFDAYLSTANIPGKTVSYTQYLSGKSEILKDPGESVTISTQQDYATVFRLTGKSIFFPVIESATGCLMSLAIGLDVAAKVSLATAIVPVISIYAGPTAGVLAFAVGCGSTIWGATKLDKTITQNEPYLVSMQLIPYNAESIKQMGCENIESIP